MPSPLLLADIWYAILGLFLALYVVLDGFTLGVGILSLFTRDESRRNTLMASLSSVWDANETWLVVFGGALFGAFPAMYGVVLHSLYIPVTVMLLALIFRGVAFEYHAKSGTQRFWRAGFGIGSLLATVAQGYALGALLGGLTVLNGVFMGSVWQWFSPFASLAALGVVFGYALLGATYLVIKTDGALQAQSRKFARYFGWLTMAVGGMISVWTPLRFDYVFTRWFSWPETLYFAPLPAAAVACFVLLLHALRREHEYRPFLWSVGIFLTSFGGLAVTLYPYLIPNTLNIHAAAAPPATLTFMLVGIGTLIPVMLTYNAYQYRVFRGKVSTQSHDKTSALPKGGTGPDY